MVYYWNKVQGLPTHTAFINRGAIRSDLVEGEITGEDILNVLPFHDEIFRIEMTGKDLIYMLECRLMQWSGLRVAFKYHSGLPGKISTAMVKCGEDLSEWCYLKDDNTIYGVAITQYLLHSSRKNCDFKDYVQNLKNGPSDFDIFSDYLKYNSPLRTKIEHRLVFLDERHDAHWIKDMWAKEDKRKKDAQKDLLKQLNRHRHRHEVVQKKDIKLIEQDEQQQSDEPPEQAMVFVFLTYMLWIPVFAIAWYAVKWNKRNPF